MYYHRPQPKWRSHHMLHSEKAGSYCALCLARELIIKMKNLNSWNPERGTCSQPKGRPKQDLVEEHPLYICNRHKSKIFDLDFVLNNDVQESCLQWQATMIIMLAMTNKDEDHIEIPNNNHYKYNLVSTLWFDFTAALASASLSASGSACVKRLNAKLIVALSQSVFYSNTKQLGFLIKRGIPTRANRTQPPHSFL